MVSWSKKKYLKLAKGYHGTQRNCLRALVPALERNLHRAYVHRQKRPSTFRKQWITTINAGVNEHGITYNQFICGLNLSN